MSITALFIKHRVNYPTRTDLFSKKLCHVLLLLACLKISDSNTKATQNPQLYPTTLVLGIYTYFSKIDEYEHCF
ncbi:hypothetical protein N9810_04030, partial [Flavobacteriaceae bacterium]|nr:hypothetical protein [Flavobacteriaceae bacterium]